MDGVLSANNLSIGGNSVYNQMGDLYDKKRESKRSLLRIENNRGDIVCLFPQESALFLIFLYRCGLCGNRLAYHSASNNSASALHISARNQLVRDDRRRSRADEVDTELRNRLEQIDATSRRRDRSKLNETKKKN